MTFSFAIAQWNISFGPGLLGIFADAWLFFLVALLLHTYLGAGIAGLLLPKGLRAYGWTLAPYLGFSLLAAVSALLVAFGGSVRTALLLTLALATAANLWLAVGRRSYRPLGSLRCWGLLSLLAASSYAITAATMAFNGSLAPVSGNLDPYVLIPLAEWLKEHSAPLFSMGSPLALAPNWNANVPPTSGWLDASAHLDYAGHRIDDSNFLFQRGTRYVEAALGLLLGWDSFLVLRPNQAFMLALALPSTFVFCRHTVRAGLWTSLLATLFLGLNGSVFFWIQLVHPGHAVGTFLVPAVIVVTLAAIESHERLPCIAGALVLTGIITSYYQGAPLLVFLLVPALAHILARSRQPKKVLVHALLIGMGALLLTLPEQLKLAMVWVSGTLVQTTGWGNPGFAPVSDGLGSSLQDRAFQAIAGQGQLGQLGLVLYQALSYGATAIGLLLGLMGLAAGSAGRMGLYRAMFLGALAMLAYLRLSGYPYGYTKGQVSITFLIAIAMALGAVWFWRFAQGLTNGPGRDGSIIRLPALLAAGMPVLLLLSVAAVNLAMSAYLFWKPIGNIWDQRTWEAKNLGEVLPANASVRFSPNALAEPESLWMALYFLRNQRVQGPMAIEQALGEIRTFPGQTEDSTANEADVEVLGKSEVPSARGLVSADLLWEGSLLRAYRSDPSATHVDGFAQPTGNGIVPIPTRLPVALRLSRDGDQREPGQSSAGENQLLMTFASQAESKVEVVSGSQRVRLDLGKGVSVRTVPIEGHPQVSLTSVGGDPVWLLSATSRGDFGPALLQEDHPKVLVAAGDSTIDGDEIATQFVYLDVQVPVSHSIDIYDSTGFQHPGWFELPTNPDERLREISFQIDAGTLEPRSTVNGQEENRPFSARPLKDGDYEAYFSIWSGSTLAKRIPLYRFRMQEGHVADFESWGLMSIWDGEAVLGNR